jgi:hypothetical protein
MSEDQEYNDFYNTLAKECPELCIVNLYVTGAILYYAGQIAKKCKTEIDKNHNKHPRWSKPRVDIIFTGKGSRIMDWVLAIDNESGKKYYRDLLIAGFGGPKECMEHIHDFKINDRNSSTSEEIKYEVAKGLAMGKNLSDRLMIPDKNKQMPLEIIGEEGFKLVTPNGDKDLDSFDTIKSNYLHQIANYFLFEPKDPNNPCPRLADFSKIFYKFAKGLFDYKVQPTEFAKGWMNMQNLPDYIKNLDDYKRSLMKMNQGEEFDYVVPIFIIEATKFYHEIILKK